MGKPLDLTGQKFGRLTAIEKLGSIKGKTFWSVKCDCGNEDLVRTTNLTSGETKSCGCLQKQVTKERSTTHGGSTLSKGAVELNAWLSHVKSNANCVVEWTDFNTFVKDVGLRPSAKHYLARRDVREPHGPTNTYWRNINERGQQRKLTHLDLGDEFFCDMRAISRANQAAKERERATA